MVELSVVLFFLCLCLCFVVVVLPVVVLVLVFCANIPLESMKPKANADTVSFFIFFSPVEALQRYP